MTHAAQCVSQHLSHMKTAFQRLRQETKYLCNHFHTTDSHLESSLSFRLSSNFVSAMCGINRVILCSRPPCRYLASLSLNGEMEIASILSRSWTCSASCCMEATFWNLIFLSMKSSGSSVSLRVENLFQEIAMKSKDLLCSPDENDGGELP